MFNYRKRAAICTLLMVYSSVQATTYTWEGVNNNLNLSGNWAPAGGPPSTGDVASFNSTLSVNKTPTTSIGFDVGLLNFTNSANQFTFNINNSTLQLNSPGSITGASLNPTLNINNINNTTVLPSLFYLNNDVTNSTGNGVVTINNTGVYQASQTNVSNVTQGLLYSFNSSTFPSLTVPTGATIAITNNGSNNDTNSGDTGYNIATANFLFGSNGNLAINDNVSLTLANIGTSSATTLGGNYVGYLLDDCFYVYGTTNVGSNVSINVSNSGTYTGTNSSDSDRVGYFSDNLLYFAGPLFQYGGNNLTIEATNLGVASGTTSIYGGNYIGSNNDTMILFNGEVNLGDNATILATNKGVNSLNSANGNYIGYNSETLVFCSNTAPFKVGDNFTMTISNEGIDNSSGVGSNYIGVADDGMFFTGAFMTLGDNASINISNSGTSTATENEGLVGYVYNGQFIVDNFFSSGNNFNLTVTNEGHNTGIANQFVGYIDGAQIFLGESFLGDGVSIYAANLGTGTVTEFQMGFGELILGGKATFQALNEGTIGDGIVIDFSSGGDLDVILGNSSLAVNSSPNSTFTLASLNGDATSNVATNPTLVIDLDAGVNAKFAGVIDNGSGASSVIIAGQGSQTLSGANTYTGLTTVNGNLILTGSLAGAATINSGGTLYGTGSVGGPVINSGIISPGLSIGTLNFLDGFTNLPTGGYDAEVNVAGRSDLINVTGTANLEGGTVYVSSADGTYAFHHTYTILDATSVTGSFSQAVGVSPLVVPTLTQDSSHVYLTLAQNISYACRTHNQCAVAAQLDSITDPTRAQNLLLSALVDLNLGQVGPALDRISGYQHSTDLFTTTAINRQFIRRLYDPVRSIVTTRPCGCPCSSGFGFSDIEIWSELGGIFTNLRGKDYSIGLNTQGFEVTAGAQATVYDKLTVGVAGSYEYDSVNFKQHGGHSYNNTWFAGLYSAYRSDMFFALADFAYGYSDQKLNRNVAVGDFGYRVNSRPQVSQFTFYGELGVDFCYKALLIQPFFGIEAGSFWRNHVHEHEASGFELDIRKRNISSATSRLGAHFTTDVSRFNFSFDVAWDCRLTQGRNRTEQSFAGFGSSFDLYGIYLTRNSVDYALTATTCVNDKWTVYVEGSGETWSRGQLYNILAGVEFSW